MHHLKRKLLNLAVGELAAAITFIILYTVLEAKRIGIANCVAFITLIFILLQGSIYWFCRYYLLLKTEKSGVVMIKIFRVLKWLNMVLLVLIAGITPFLMENKKDLIIAILIFSFGVIEYVNYYWYRLSYGKSGFNIRMLLESGLKKSNMNKWISSD